MKHKPKSERDLLKAEHEFIAAFGKLWSHWGLSRTAGLILGALFLADQDEPLDASDLAEVLHVSRSTLSAALSELLSAKLISTSTMLGSRSERYTTATNLYELYLEVFNWIRRRDIEVALAASRKARETLSNNGSPKVGRFKGRVEHAVKFYEALHGQLEIIQRMNPEQFRKYLAVPEEEIAKLIQKHDDEV